MGAGAECCPGRVCASSPVLLRPRAPPAAFRGEPMNVVPFTPKMARSLRSWSPHELETLVSIYEAHRARGEASGWDVGATDYDDPQFYILGPGPDLDCIVAISRVGCIYVLENGTGQLLDESPSLETLAIRAKMPPARLRHVPLCG